MAAVRIRTESQTSQRRISFLLYLAGAAINIAGCYYDRNYAELPSFRTYGGRAKYLTHWSQYLHTIFCIYATLLEIGIGLGLTMSYGKRSFESSSKQVSNEQNEEDHMLLKIRDYFFATVCFPFGVNVVILFWGITAVDPAGVAPLEVQKIVPLNGWYNHYLHTFPIIFDMLAVYFVYHQYPYRKLGILTTTMCGAAYLAWLLWIAKAANFWTYPFLGELDVHEFIVFTLGAFSLSAFYYLIGERINYFAWIDDRKKKE